MNTDQLKFGITLSNRGVVLGTRTPRDLLTLADKVEQNALFDSVWVGDALFVNRRLDAIPLLAAIAGRTERVLLGPAAMGSFALRNPLVFAYEWASIDQIANGRTRLIVAAGGGGETLWNAECIESLKQFRGSGARRITLRLSTEKNEAEQFDKLVNEVLPYVNEGSAVFSADEKLTESLGQPVPE